MLQRDSHSQAIINTDVASLNKYKQERALHKKLNSLAQEVSECKKVLESVCERLDRIENR